MGVFIIFNSYPISVNIRKIIMPTTWTVSFPAFPRVRKIATSCGLIAKEDILLPRLKIQFGPMLSVLMMCGGTCLDYTVIDERLANSGSGILTLNSALFLQMVYIPLLAIMALIHLFLVGNSDPGYVGIKALSNEHGQDWSESSHGHETEGLVDEESHGEGGEHMENRRPWEDPQPKRSYGDKRHQYYDFCERCKVNLPMDRSICHCDSCDACIDGMDHHCPWVGNCVGLKNEKFFWRFNACWALLLVQLVLTVILG